MTAPSFHGYFPHHWTAEILPQRPMILPSRHYVYPAMAEEVEKGALEVLVAPGKPDAKEVGRGTETFLATCALGFRDPAAPTGIWAMPDPDWLCAVSGGYAYLIDVAEPSRFVFLRYRPVLQVLSHAGKSMQSATRNLQSATEDAQSAADNAQSASGSSQSRDNHGLLGDGLLLFAGHHSILAWGRDGEAWESERLSSEGITNLRIEIRDGIETLCGEGWDMRTDKDLPFALNLRTGRRLVS